MQDDEKNVCNDCEFSRTFCPYRILNNYQKINVVKSHITGKTIDCVSLIAMYREFHAIKKFRKENLK